MSNHCIVLENLLNICFSYVAVYQNVLPANFIHLRCFAELYFC